MRMLMICFGLLLHGAASEHSAWATFISAQPAEALAHDPGRGLDEDACPPATIVSLPITLSGNTSTSVNNFAVSCGLAGSSPDDIYALSVSCRGWVTASLCGSGYDCVLEARAGANYFDCPGTYITCNDDYCDVQSQLSFFVEAGEYYFLIVSGYFNAAGPYTLNVTQAPEPPVNDQCAGSLLFTQLPFRHFGSTVCAANNYAGSCGGASANDVVYTMMLPCGTRVRATTCGHPLMDAVIHVRTGGDCPGATEVACNDDACANFQSSVDFNASGNVPYYIVVDAFSDNSGYYVLHVEATYPTGCPETICLTLPCASVGNTSCAANTYPQCFAGESAEEIVSFNITECSQVTVSLCGSDLNWDSVLEIRTGGECPCDSLVACVDDGYCGDVFSLHGTASFIAEPGAYIAMINGYNGSAGGYYISINAAPCAPPAAPDSLVLRYIPATLSFELTWAPVAGAETYHIYRTASFPASGPPIPDDWIGTTSETTFVDDATHPPNPNGYFYRVTANSAFAVNSHQQTPGKAVPQQATFTERPAWLDHYEYATK